MGDIEKLEIDLKKLIIEKLNLEDISVEDIKSDELLFGDGLNLDSIDALELGMALKKTYNITLSTEEKENHKHFESVQTLAQFLYSQM
jgi:acyl carrier protein